MVKLKSAVGRRTIVAGLAGALAAPAIVRAQGTYPNRLVRYINPFPAGGATDTLSRILCQKLTELSGQQFIVENRSGSAGNVGMDVLAKSDPDGYTLGLGGIATHAISPTLYAKLPFDARNDFTFITTMWSLPNMLVVNLDVPAKTVAELIDLLKKNPGKYSYASAGSGTTLHLSGELFKMLAGVDMLHVPYRGASPALSDTVAGHVHLFCGNLPPTMPFIKTGQLRPLGVTTLQRNGELPDVPTIAESGFAGFETVAWFGLFAPKGTQAAIINRLQTEIADVLKTPEVAQRLASLGTEPVGDTPESFRRFVSNEIEKWTRVAQAANVKLD